LLLWYKDPIVSRLLRLAVYLKIGAGLSLINETLDADKTRHTSEVDHPQNGETTKNEDMALELLSSTLSTERGDPTDTISSILSKPLLELSDSEAYDLRELVTKVCEAVAVYENDPLTNNPIPVDQGVQKEAYLERMIYALLKRKQAIQSRIQPLEEQIVVSTVEYLQEMFESRSQQLSKCTNAIEQHLLDCKQNLESYERIRKDLIDLGERLNRLGVAHRRTTSQLQEPVSVDAIRQEIRALENTLKLWTGHAIFMAKR